MCKFQNCSLEYLQMYVQTLRKVLVKWSTFLGTVRVLQSYTKFPGL